MILDQIVANTQKIVLQQKKFIPLENLIVQISQSAKNFKQALVQGRGINLIAEVKRKSPSRGIINNNLNIPEIIDIYDKNPNVKAISFLTDEKYFGGSLEELRRIHSKTNKPILRKDFIIDKYQIYQARYFGADAILLIARILTKRQMAEYINIAKTYNMDCLVEIHNQEDIAKVPKNAEIIGINNRNLANMEISLNNTIKLSKIVRDKAEVIVTESGILSSEDVQKVNVLADAMLVGSAIMADNNPARKIDSLFRPQIKICGITSMKDAQMCAEYGSDLLGFIFYENSKRYITPEEAEKIILPINRDYPSIKTVGVFVNTPFEKINSIEKRCKLDYLQLHGDEPPGYAKKFGDRAIKAFRVTDDTNSLSKIGRYNTEYILLDAFHSEKYGGTGKAFDWELLKQLPDHKIFLAGGINPDNYSLAISYQPYAVDINSGVEKAPGKKDERLVKDILTRK